MTKIKLKKQCIATCLSTLLYCVCTLSLAGEPLQDSVSLVLPVDPPSLNHLIVTDQTSAFVLGHVMEGLMQYDSEGYLRGAVAKSWQLSEQEARFQLRADARWQDGKPVTADDFVFAWQTLLKPETASPSAALLYPLVNAREINEGRLAPDSLGVVALDEHNLLVRFAQPCPYFLSLTAYVSLYPLRQDHYRNPNSYGSDLGQLLFNGPYHVSDWVRGSKLRLDKSPQYWNAARINIHTIRIDHITSDRLTQFNLYRDGKIGFVELDANTLPLALQQTDPVRQFSSGYMFFLRFNFRTDRATRHLPLRKAIQEVIRQTIITNKVVALPGVRASRSFFPSTLYVQDAAERLDREHWPKAQLPGNSDLALARRYYRDYLQQLDDPDKPPTLSLLSNESATGLRIAQYLQQLLKQSLGIDLQIDKQTAKHRLSKERAGKFDLSLASWGADFDDPLSFAEVFQSTNANNRGAYVNLQYDQLVQALMENYSAQKRAKTLTQLDRIIHEDVVVIPLYESVVNFLQKPGLKSVRRSLYAADPDLRYAYWERQ